MLNIFRDSTGLTEIVVENGNPKYDSRNNCNAIIETESNTLIAGCKSTIIPNSVTTIGSSAFRDTPWYDNQPDGLVYTGMVAYKYKGTMPSGTSIVLKDGCTGIAGGAFGGCTGLTSVSIPNSVTTIGGRAFLHCTGLTEITIPNSVTSIGFGAFGGCSGLTSFKSRILSPDKVVSKSFFEPYEPSWIINGAFYGVDKNNCTLYVPQGTKDIYQATPEWSYFFVNIVEVPFAPGDVNYDDECTGSDVTALYNFILYNDNSAVVNGDQNGDGEITGSDVTAVYNIILGL